MMKMRTPLGRYNRLNVAIAGLLFATGTVAASQPAPAPLSSVHRIAHDQTVVVHNPYTGRDIAAQISLPERGTQGVGVVVFAEDTDADRLVARQVAWDLNRRGLVVMRVFERGAEADIEGAELSALAALGYLRTISQVRGGQVGIVGYGAAVPAVAAAAEQPRTAAFIALLGGRIRTPEGSLMATVARGAKSQESAPKVNKFECPTLMLVGDRDETNEQITVDRVNEWKRRTTNDPANRLVVRILPDHDRRLQQHRARTADAEQSGEISTAALRTATGWIQQQARSVEGNTWSESDAPIVRIRSSRPAVRVAGVGITFEFPYHPYYVWRPPVGGQSRPYGDWYW